ncbi:MAG: AAA family ATPase [Nitrososphaera sp.]
MMWSEKHRPVAVEQMVGNEDARLIAVKWLTGWVSGSKPLLLVGPPGTGKTTLVHVLAKNLGYDLLEMNASDARNRDVLHSRIMPVFQNTGLLGRKTLLFLDEVDGISGREDSGGLDALADMMKEPTVPVIMAANEKSAKIKDLAKMCKTVEFSPIPPRLQMLFLDHVMKKEGMELGHREKFSVVNNSRGDMRSMLNGAQSRVSGYATGSNKDIVGVDIAEAIDGYFNSGSMEEAAAFIAKAKASYHNPRYEVMTPEARRTDKLGALFSSIVSSRLEREDLAGMLDILSRADIHIGRASVNRHWSLLRYVDNLVAAGLYERSRKKAIRYSQHAMPWPVMGPIFARSQSTRKILSVLAQAVRTSRSSAGSLVMPYFIRFMIDKKIDPVKFAADNFGDGSAGESIAKEMEKAAKKK